MRHEKKIIELIDKADRILLAGHVNPDGDCIGSVLALGLGLKVLNKKVDMYVQGALPRVYNFLPGAKDIVHRLTDDPDVSISLDCNTKEMLGRAWKRFETAHSIIEIDHHEYRRPFGTVEWVNPHSSCVGEMVYELLNALGVEITPDIATNILTSLLIESGSFRFPSVTSKTFMLVGKLMKLGVDYYSVVSNLFMSRNKEATLLSGICLSRCKFIAKGMIAWSIIRKKDFLKVKGKDEDVDPVPDEMRSIHGVKIAILFRESGRGKLRVSLRSKRKVNIAILAEQYGGGGHIDVAGCIIKNTPTHIRKFLEAAQDLLKDSQ